MTDIPKAADVLERVLARRASLSDGDRASIRALTFTTRRLEPNSYIIREGDPPRECAILLSGYAFRHKLAADGGRQIISLHVPGDILDLQNLFLEVADHNLQSLSRANVGLVLRRDLLDMAAASPAIAQAVSTLICVEASSYREWILNLGRRGARQRVAHLFCEFACKMDEQGSADGRPYVLPMTQEQIGDATGLTSVHVNRMLKLLEQDGLLTRRGRLIEFPSIHELQRLADFNTRYLHLGERSTAQAEDGNRPS